MILNRSMVGDTVRSWLLTMAKNFGLKFIFFPRFYTSLAMVDLETWIRHDDLYPITPAICIGLHSLVTKIASGHLPNFFDIHSTETENQQATKEILERMKKVTSGFEDMFRILKSIKYLKTIKRKLEMAFDEQLLYFAIPGSVNTVKNQIDYSQSFLPPTQREGGRKRKSIYNYRKAKKVYT